VTNWALALPPRGGEIAGESTGQSLPLQSLAPRRRQRDGFARVTGSLVVSLRSSDPNEFQSRETGICTVCAPFPSNLRRDTNARRSSLESSLIARDRGDRRGEERWEYRDPRAHPRTEGRTLMSLPYRSEGSLSLSLSLLSRHGERRSTWIRHISDRLNSTRIEVGGEGEERRGGFLYLPSNCEMRIRRPRKHPHASL